MDVKNVKISYGRSYGRSYARSYGSSYDLPYGLSLTVCLLWSVSYGFSLMVLGP